jgi:DNA-binding transcriptional LysR family regulator
VLDLKDLDCLIALTRHRHFAKAADELGLSQPAFSMRIRHLEERLGTQIVKRGNRFQGLTPEGETIVLHARIIHDQVRALEDEVRAARGEVVGTLILAAIPTATAFAARIANALRSSHPGIRVRVDSASSQAIQKGVDEGRFDAGLTYSEGVSSDLMTVEDLYIEQYMLWVPDALDVEGDEITWHAAAALPMILLEPEMQNRRILDNIFAEAGAAPDVVAETNGFIAAMAMAREGMGATVLPKVLVDSLGALEGGRILDLVDPVAEKPVCLVSPRRAQSVMVVDALRRTVAALVQ